MAEKMILPNTSLCSIVRDEKINPAGGIQRFVESHVPFVEEAVIVDTGSLDGTREILEELESQYPNLRIYDVKFKGFAHARNYSLKKVKTKYSLVLDADELICHENPYNGWEPIKEFLEESNDSCFGIDIMNVHSNGEELWNLSCWNARLFTTENTKFHRYLYEDHNKITFKFLIPDTSIKHFLPEKNALKYKKDNFYAGTIPKSFRKNIIKTGKAPSQIKGFEQWKSYNPSRDNYK